MKKAILALEDGTVLHGISIGCSGHTVGEVVFNTAMTGYQEILTDPSYTQQIVTLTHPHIGNVGVNIPDNESKNLAAAGLVIRDLSLCTSNWRSEQSLSEFLNSHHLVAIADIDTRHLTRIIREKGALRGCILANDHPTPTEALSLARNVDSLVGCDLAKIVSTKTSYTWQQASWTYPHQQKKISKVKYRVIAYDFGVKATILNLLVDRGCSVQVVPAETSAEEVLALQPDGIFLSNGPGDPAACTYAIQAIQRFLQTEIPLFGICLGHQLLALAAGAETAKMKFGHHGANHPVQDLATKKVWITSQNHGFAVVEATLPPTLRATHRSLFDGTLQGIRHTEKPAFGFQGHPEASPGPHEAAILFDQFVKLMERYSPPLVR